MRSLRYVFAAGLFIVLAFAACSHRTNNAQPSATASAPKVNVSRGGLLFAANCASCHGTRGTGARIGPALHDERKRRTPSQIRTFITDPQPPMPKLYPAQLSAQDVDDLTAYVETL